MPKRNRTHELTTSPPPAAPPKPKTGARLDTWELREAIEALSSARERRAEAARAAHPGGGPRALALEELAERTQDAASEMIARCVLLLTGQAETLEAIAQPGFTWTACGVSLRGFSSNWLAWIEPYVTNEGAVSYEPGHAVVSIVDMAEVDELDADDA